MSKDEIKDNTNDLLLDDKSSNPPIEDEEPTAPGWSKKDIKHNIIVLAALMTAFQFGWENYALAFQPYLAHLKMSNTLTGLIMGADILALPGLFLSPFISRKLKQKKIYALSSNALYILMIGLLGLNIVFADKLGLTRQSLIIVTIILISCCRFISGFVLLPVQEFVSGCIPASFRGRFGGITGTTGSIAGFATTALGGWILYSQPEPKSFGYLFIILWVICTLSWLSGLNAREKHADMDKVPKAWSKDMIMAALTNKPIVRLAIVSFLTTAFFSGGSTFVMQYGYKELQLPSYNSAIFTTISLIGHLVVAFPIGYLVDRFGPKKFIPFWGIIEALGLLMVIIFPNKWGIYAKVVINVTLYPMFSRSTGILNACLPKPENRAGTYTLMMIIGRFSSLLNKVIAGRMCDVFGYRKTFIIFAIASLFITPAWIWVSKSLRDDRKDLH